MNCYVTKLYQIDSLFIWVTRLGGVTRLSIQSLILIESRLYDRLGHPPHVTSPIWGPSPPRKQVMSLSLFQRLFAGGAGKYIGGTFMKLTVIERSLIDAFQALKRIELQFTKQSNILQMYLWRYL